MSSETFADVSSLTHEVVLRHGCDPARLLQILVTLQDALGHIPPEAIQGITKGLWIPRSQVEAVVDFYAFLTPRPSGNYRVLFSDNITDWMAGKQACMARLCEKLRVAGGAVRDDGLVSVADTSCIGLSDQGPAALVNGYPVTRLDEARVDQIAGLIEGRLPLRDWPAELFHVEDNIQRKELLLAGELEDGAAVRAVCARGAEEILAETLGSGLRGMGGAGFKTGVKWGLCRNAPADERFVVCNADEGEPGTFKDRVLLRSYAELVFEGMTVCARVIGARRGYLYLRGEYRFLQEHLTAVLERRRRANLLGEHILGVPDFSFDIDIHLGAGAYICGEESALVESMEGKRGIPRIRPPFPVTGGYLHKPTVVNNVETFAFAAKIAAHGGDWYASRGTSQSPGTKLFSVAGDCARPGIYEFPFGVTVQDVLAACGASNTQAVQVSGAAGSCVPRREFQRRLAFEDLATGGSFMVFDASRDMLEVAHNFARFFAHESCGFCTPCRVGTSLMQDLVAKVTRGDGTELDLREIRRLADVMTHLSHCGLGQTAGRPAMDILSKFSEACHARLKAASFEPAFDLDGALEVARQLTGRRDREAHL